MNPLSLCLHSTRTELLFQIKIKEMGVRVGSSSSSSSSSSVSCVATSSISSLPRPTSATNSQLTLLRLPCGRRQCNARWIRNVKGIKSFCVLHNLTMKKRKSQDRICAAHVEQPQYDVLEPVNSEDENDLLSSDGTSSSSHVQFEGSNGKSGFVSFYSHRSKEENKVITFYPQKNQNRLQWFLGPTVLVTSFIVPSLYLRKILSSIFEDSLLTDFLILFFTEALFYCGVGVFLLIVDRTRKPTAIDSVKSYQNLAPQIGQRISSVATLVLSLIIPMVTMGFVWPWTGPAASAALAPYLVGIVVQFAFEQYAKYRKSPSLSVIPIVFQVYRLHQLNRAAQLVTALSFTVRGAEMSSHNIAISSSLGTLLNVLQFLGVICIWSLASFIMRYNPPPIIASE